MRSGTSENRKNTEFATILEMGLREAYPHRALAVLAHGALNVISEGYVCEKIYAEPVRGLAYEY